MLCLLLVGRKRKKKKKERVSEREMTRGHFFPEPDMPCWLYHMKFSWLLVVIKG
jgi:hypothetical protein